MNTKDTASNTWLSTTNLTQNQSSAVAQAQQISKLLGFCILRRLSFSSQTYLCRERTTERLVVIKFFTGSKRTLGKNEALTLTKLQNILWVPKIFLFMELDEAAFPISEPTLILIQEFKNGTQLEVFLENNRKNFVRIQTLKEAILLNMSMIHKGHKLTHCDLSPRNILVLDELEPKFSIIDWEFSQPLDRMTTDPYLNFRGSALSSEEVESGHLTDLVTRDLNIIKKIFPNQLREAPTWKQKIYNRLRNF